MAYSVPSLRDLSQRARSTFRETSGAAVTLFANTFLAFGKVTATLVYEVHLRLAFLYRQIFASTADDLWLDRHGFELGLARKPAARAVGQATATATAGLVVPAGIRFRRADGAFFLTRASALASGTSVTMPVEAEAPGFAGNSAALVELTLDDPAAPIGLGSLATVSAAGLGGGAEGEEREAFRARVLARKRNGGETGKASDWRRWVAETPGVAVSRVFVDSFIGDARQVWVAFLMDGRADGTPTASDVAAVQAYVDDGERRPVTARVTVVALQPVPVPVTISNLAGDRPEIRAAIEGELRAMFAARSAPAKPSGSFTLWRAWIDEAISRATGEDRHTLLAPAGDTVFAVAPQFPVLGTVSYT